MADEYALTKATTVGELGDFELIEESVSDEEWVDLGSLNINGQ